MNKICTTIEQSKKLIELGIDVNTADMCYINGKANIGFLSEEYKMFGDNILTDYWPAWSLSALLGLMPKFTLEREVSNEKFLLYYNYNQTYYNDPVDAAFGMICWLKKYKKI